MNMFVFDVLNGLSPYELAFVRCTPDIGNTYKTDKEYYNILKERAQLIVLCLFGFFLCSFLAIYDGQ